MCLLSPAGCVSKRTVLHEIGHAIGFFHEQSRPDRDYHIQVVWENIDPNKSYNFDKSNQINLYGVPYDFTSIMHYGPYSWSINDKVTIRSIDPKYQERFGYSRQLSFYDIMLANRMYQCDSGCDPTVRCPDDGFKGKDCKCYCKGYISYMPLMECCPVDFGANATVSPVKCEDKSRACGSWVAESR